MITQFKTIKQKEGPIEFKEKGSRFISFAFPVLTSDEAEEELKNLKKLYFDCTHICFAYILGEGEEKQFRYSDDGEPSGTAGIPIYNAIKREELFNVLVASVRYYGGTKLGTGGLFRAYGHSAELILKNCEKRIVALKSEIPFSVDFEQTGLIMHIINLFAGIEIKKQNYTEKGIDFVLKIPVDKVESFKMELKEKSSGKIIL